MRHLPASAGDPNLLVGFETSDDAGVYRLTDDLALVQTVDYFTPVVDDPFAFGQIAAANALSDIYAMGALPLTAMNIIGFPVGRLDLGVMAEILRGGAEKVKEAGAVLVGGHSLDDPEPKYGLSVTGVVKPGKFLTNSSAKPGDRLILTKPLGVGMITTAIKQEAATEEIIAEVTAIMSTLNKTAAEAMLEVGVNACTDITGFGLLGHTSEMARGSGVGMRIAAGRVPVIDGTREFAEKRIVPGGTRSNLKYLLDERYVLFADELSREERLILCDAITSGGLLISVPEERAGRLLELLHSRGVKFASEIGEVTSDHPGKIAVTP